MPSIKTDFNIIRLNNCVILEREQFGFFFLNRGNDDLDINDIYLDWDTKLLGLYKLVDSDAELFLKIVISGRNKIIISLNQIKGNYGYYFHKVSDDIGEYKLSTPTKLKTDNTKKEAFKFTKGEILVKNTVENHHIWILNKK